MEINQDYHLHIGLKTRLLNRVRNLLKFPIVERLLISYGRSIITGDLWIKLVPPNYLYDKGTIREVERNGIKYRLDISDCVEHGVYFAFEEASQKTLFELAKNRRAIIDVGTNIGCVLMNFARLSPDAVVYGFEPDAANFEKARTNLSLNQFQNVNLNQKALGTHRAKAKIYSVNENNAGMNRIRVAGEGHDGLGEGSEIEVISLDDFVEKTSIKTVDLIKIDVEGFELNVLKGAQHSLRRFRPTLFVELDDNNLREQGSSAEELVVFIEQLGYRVYRADKAAEISSDQDFKACHYDVICEPIKNEISANGEN
jgi:FkbM family methyltransferase